MTCKILSTHCHMRTKGALLPSQLWLQYVMLTWLHNRWGNLSSLMIRLKPLRDGKAR
uniref:Uncharacterized protein n=1 Tax=Rhizophora mucronata TaxID=61149 RepID=A0A2P2IKH6_RHIMU